MKICKHCGSTDFFEGVPFGSSRINNHTTKFKPAIGPIFNNNNPNIYEAEAVYTDICKSCGTLRMYVKDLDNKWCTASDIVYKHKL